MHRVFEAFAVALRATPDAGLPVLQRDAWACELNVYLDSIVLDGVYVDEADGRPGFRLLPAPTAAEVPALTEQVARRVTRVLRRRGLLDATVPYEATR
jgi:hypothetical protein